MKNYNIKIFNSDGTTLLKTLKPTLRKSRISFRQRINSGQEELVLSLDFPFDDYDTSFIGFENIIEVSEFDPDNTSGRSIYKGVMTQIVPFLQGSSEGVEIVCIGLVSLLSREIYKTAGGAFSVTHTSVDPKTIIEDILTRFNAVYSGGLIIATPANLDTVGTNVTYTFENQTWLQAINKTLELSGGDFYFFVDKDGEFYFKQKPSTVDHVFTIAKDVESFSNQKSSEDIINAVHVIYNGGTVDVTDATSITDFGRRGVVVKDNDITDATTATQRGQKELDDNKDEKTKPSIIINNVFDIESVRPGNTCNINNLKTGIQVFKSAMLIVSTTYTENKLKIEVEQETANFAEEIKKTTQ